MTSYRLPLVLAVLVALLLPGATVANHALVSEFHFYRATGQMVAGHVYLRSAGAEYDALLLDVIDTWDAPNDRAAMLAPFAAQNADSTRSTCPMPASDWQIRVCTWNWGTDPTVCPTTGPDWGCLFTTGGSGSHYTRGKIKVNLHYATTPDLVRGLMCHEIGHSRGLGEQPDNTRQTCMNLTLYPHPEQHDYDSVKAIFDHAH
jgi:hypothetical protein